MSNAQLIFQTLGGFGLFFFGWRLLTRSFRSVLSLPTQKLISYVSIDRGRNTLIGTLLGVMLLSGSAASVMVLSFANSGLMTLQQTLALIFGTSFGGTITGWFLTWQPSEMTTYLLIGLGSVPFLVLRQPVIREIGRFIFALGLVFGGLVLFASASKELIFTYVARPTTSGILFSILAVALLTHLSRSTTISIGLILALNMNGSLGLIPCLAMVLGIHVGSSFTTLHASAKTHVQALRAAILQFAIRIAFVLLAILFMPFFLQGLDHTVFFLSEQLSMSFVNRQPVQIALANSLFSLFVVLGSMPFLPSLTKASKRLFPSRGEKEPYHIQVLDQPTTFIPTLGIHQLREEQKKLSAMVQIMLEVTNGTLTNEEGFQEAYNKVKKYEKITDVIQREMQDFLYKLEHFRLTSSQAKTLTSINRLVFEIEIVADSCETILDHRSSLASQPLSLNQEVLGGISALFENVLGFYEFLFSVVINDGNCKTEECRNRLLLVDNQIEDAKNEYLEKLNKGLVESSEVLVFSNILLSIFRIHDHVSRIAEVVLPEDA